MSSQENRSTAMVPFCRKSEPDLYAFVVSGVFPMFLLLFGIGGIIYSRRRLARSTSKLVGYILFLYNWDVLLLISTFGFYGVATVFATVAGVKHLYGFHIYFYIVFYPLVNLSMTGSIWTIVVISIERFLALSQPLRHRSRDPRRVSIVIRAVVFLGAVAVNVPRMLELKFTKCWDGEGFKHQIAPTDLRLDPNYNLVYGVVFSAIFLCPLPFLIICVVTLKTWFIRRTAVRTQNRRNRDRTTFLLLLMICKFLLCETCPTILNVIESFTTDVRVTSWFTYVVHMSNLLVILNSATNWLLFKNMPSGGSRLDSRTMTLLRNRSSSLVTLSPKQLELLKKVWTRDRHHKLGDALVKVVLYENPSLKEKLSHLHCVEGHDHEESVQTVAKRIEDLLDAMFQAALHGRSFDGVKSEISAAAQAHTKYGIVLRNSDWAVIKKFLSDRLFGSCNEEQQQLGGRMLNSVVSELKFGFLYC